MRSYPIALAATHRSPFPMSSARQLAIETIATTDYDLNQLDFRTTHIKDLFGVNVFSEEVQKARLPKPVFRALQKTIKQGAQLTDPAVADAEHGSTQQPGASYPEAVRKHRGEEGLHHGRPGAGILPHRQKLSLRPARPAQLRPDPVRCEAAQGAGTRRSVLRHHPGAGAGLHGRQGS